MKATNNFYQKALIATTIILIAVSTLFAVYLIKNKTKKDSTIPEIENIPKKETILKDNETIRQSNPITPSIKRRFSNMILF